MRSFVAIGATVLASVAGSASAVGVTFTGMPASGSYTDVKSLSTSGECTWGDKVHFTGKTSPLDEELSVVFRGPFQMKQFAVYNLDSSAPSKSKRDHLRKHKRHSHQQFHEANKVKRDAEAEPVMVTATIDGVVTHFEDTWNTPAAVAPAAAVAKVAAPAADESSPAAQASPSDAPSFSAGAGNYVRKNYYNAASGTAQGVSFLSNDNWANYLKLGAVLGHVSGDGQNFATEPCILQDVLIPDNTEVVISSNTPCTDGSCGSVAPGAAAYHGFGGAEKVLVFEFTMPDSGKASSDIYSNDNKPALWLLNTKIVNNQQYAGCSCWASGCGEFDIHEILESGNNTGYATMHMGENYSGMAAALGFERPVSTSMKMAVIITADVAHIEVLPDSTSFGPILNGATVSGWLNGDAAGEAKSAAARYVFNVITGPVPTAASWLGEKKKA